MTARAAGPFEVTVTPAEQPEGVVPGRMLLDKRFSGELEATSKGQMLAFMTAVLGSAGYVAIEQVTGTLAGRSGTFALEHTGLMNRGAPSLSVVVIPDSATGELTGLTGSMRIIIEGGKHSYEFEYTLPALVEKSL